MTKEERELVDAAAAIEADIRALAEDRGMAMIARVLDAAYRKARRENEVV